MAEFSTPQEQARFIFNTGKLIRDRINRIVAARQAQSACFARFGEISAAQLHALLFIHTRGGMSITELAQTLSVSAPSASAMVDRLEEKGLVVRVREADPHDRRKVMVRISPEAVREMEAVEETILQSFVDLIQKIGPETAKQWCHILEKVHEVLIKETERLQHSS